MGPQEFEHVIAAAAEVTSQDEFVVIGSQAILGSVGQPPPSLLQSLPADIYPLRDPAAADLIDSALGGRLPISSGVWLLRARRRPRDSEGTDGMAGPSRPADNPAARRFHPNRSRLVS